jgi:hypothetical protein
MFDGTDSVFNTGPVSSNISYKSFKSYVFTYATFPLMWTHDSVNQVLYTEVVSQLNSPDLINLPTNK